jgi:L-ascorbate metabolism protein UlaG (beta-lactamase superfamily)
MRALAGLLTGLLCAACSSNSYYDASKPHHTPEGFRNNYLQQEMVSSLLKWQWERWRDGLPRPPANNYHFPLEQPDLSWLHNNHSQPSVTWIGHATVLVQINGVNILTDPIFSKRAAPVQWTGPQRKVPPAIRLDQLPHIDVVLISHNHYDHLDRDSVMALNAQKEGAPLFLVPLGMQTWMHDQGIRNVRELDWWQSLSYREVDLHFVPVQHWSARSVTDRFDTLWGGWIAKTKPKTRATDFSVFFAGDTGYSKDFSDIYQRFGAIDLALLPIGAYAPRWFMQPQHVNPEEAVRIHQDLHAKKSLGIHWGTFELSDEALDEPPRALAEAVRKASLPASAFVVLPHGGMLRF